MPAKLIERGSLHRKNSPVGIIGRMGAGENIERLLEIAVIGKRPAIGGEQRLVAGMGDGALFEHGYGLRALSGGTEWLNISQGGLSIPGAITLALAINVPRASRIGTGAGIGL